MPDELRDTLDRAAPTVLVEPDFEQVWHRGRRRRRTRHLSAVVATVVLVVAAGWTTQQLATPGSLQVVDQPDDGAGLQLHADAVWRAPAPDAKAAIEEFTAQAFGWSAGAVDVEGADTGSSGPRFVTASNRDTELAIQMLLTPGPQATWQVVQVGPNGGGTGTAEAITYPVPTGATTMQVYAFANDRTVRQSGTATGTIRLADLGVRDYDALGAVLVIYRDGTGKVVGARGGVAGTAEQPSAPDAPTARQLLEDWQNATARPIVVPTELPEGYHMVIANHYAPTSPDSSLPPVAACVEPAGTTDNTCTPTDDPSPRTSFDVDGHTLVLEVMDGSRDQTILNDFEQLDWTTQWRQVDWIDTAFEQT